MVDVCDVYARGLLCGCERKGGFGQRKHGQWEALMGRKNRYCIPRSSWRRQRRGMENNVVVGLDLVILCCLHGQLILLPEARLVRHRGR